MARRLDPSEADFSRSRDNGWFDKEWLNGEPWLLEHDVDFQGKGETVRTRLYNEAAKATKGARAKILGNGDVIFQAYDKTEEEIQRTRVAAEKRAATRQANIASGVTVPKRGKKAAA